MPLITKLIRIQHTIPSNRGEGVGSRNKQLQIEACGDQMRPVPDHDDWMMERLLNRKWRELLGRHIFGRVSKDQLIPDFS
jgi:hypothetical protein